MRYPIGRISKLLGLSTETIRTYERKGIVHPQKNENGYRTFHVLDIGHAAALPFLFLLRPFPVGGRRRHQLQQRGRNARAARQAGKNGSKNRPITTSACSTA